MALFAHIAAPQVRLTKDPNTFFFFLDHLAQESPFRLEDDTTWDTNIELGIAWGMRLIEKDTEIHGKSPNAKAFVLITDGQAWSGEVARALKTRAPTMCRSTSSASAPRSAASFRSRERKPNDTSPREPPMRAVARPRLADADRQRRRRRVPRARSRRRPRDREPDHRRGAAARRVARARGVERGAVLALPARGRGADGGRPAVPAGAGGVVAAGGRRRRRARAGLDADALMRSRTAPVAALLFGSGFCALVYQVGWLREFRLIFGASTAASAAVLAIFIGGLGAGGLLLGPRADRHPRPLLLLRAARGDRRGVGGAQPAAAVAGAGGLSRQRRDRRASGSPAATVERLLLSALVLAVPTVAMGGTLPAAARAVTRAVDVAAAATSPTLYALNTLGAVAGCVVATFFLLEDLGTRATLWLAAAINLLVAVAARAPGSSEVRGPVPFARHAPPAPAANLALGLAGPPAFLLLASGTVGFAFFLMELVWYRMLGPLLGGSVFTFGLVLAVALAGIGIGGLLYSLIAGDRPASLSGFAASCLLEAAAVAATFALGDRVALLALALRAARRRRVRAPRSPAGRWSPRSSSCRRRSSPAISFRC